MGMQTDVLSGYAGSTGAVTAARSRIKGILISYAANGTVDLYDTATTPGLGQTKAFAFVAPNAAGSVYMLLPGEGILCSSGIYATLSTATVTVFYG